LIHGQTIWDKNEQLLGINWELGKVDGNLMGVAKKTQVLLGCPTPPKPKRKKKFAPPEPSHWLHAISNLQNNLTTIFNY
jgi:hypothetical protein